MERLIPGLVSGSAGPAQVCLTLDPEQVEFTRCFLPERGHSSVSIFHHSVEPPFGNLFSPRPHSIPAAAHAHSHPFALSVVPMDLCLCGHLYLCVLGALCLARGALEIGVKEAGGPGGGGGMLLTTGFLRGAR